MRRLTSHHAIASFYVWDAALRVSDAPLLASCAPIDTSGPDSTVALFRLFASLFRFFELFTNAVATHLIVFQTRKKNEKTKRKSEKSAPCSQAVTPPLVASLRVCWQCPRYDSIRWQVLCAPRRLGAVPVPPAARPRPRLHVPAEKLRQLPLVDRHRVPGKLWRRDDVTNDATMTPWPSRDREASWQVVRSRDKNIQGYSCGIRYYYNVQGHDSRLYFGDHASRLL